jgi:uncharacterized protein
MTAPRTWLGRNCAAARLLRLLHDLPRATLVWLVLAYRLVLKPWLGNACRFEPSCSAYALEALQRHGAVAGAALSTARVLRCQPWCRGGHDPVPERPPRLFTRLTSKTRQ